MYNLIPAIPIFILILFIVAIDLYEIHRYKKATICEGKVIRSLGTDTYHYRSGIEFYETYEVRFNYNDKVLTDQVLTYKTGLHPGAPIEVHIEDFEDGYEILTDKYCIKLNNLLLSLFLFSAIIGFLFLMAYTMTYL